MKRLICLSVLLAVVGCGPNAGSRDDLIRRGTSPYLHQPVSDFAEGKSLAPEQMFDRPDGRRTYTFRNGMCGYTLIAHKAGSVYITDEIISNCP